MMSGCVEANTPLARKFQQHMKPALRTPFIAAGGFASALLVFAFASAGEEAHRYSFNYLPTFAASVSIEDIGARETERLMRADENEDGEVTFDEYREHGTLTEFLTDFEDMEIEEIIDWSEELVEKSKHRMVIKKIGDASTEVRMQRGPWSRVSKRKGDDWFDVADANGDGVLDRAEVEGAPERMREQRSRRTFDRLDANDDDVLSEADVEQRIAKLEALDEDDDGTLSRSEVVDLMRLLAPRAPALAEPMTPAMPLGSAHGRR